MSIKRYGENQRIRASKDQKRCSMRERIMYRRIALALASMALVSPLAMHPVMAAAEDEVYDFGSSDI